MGWQGPLKLTRERKVGLSKTTIDSTLRGLSDSGFAKGVVGRRLGSGEHGRVLGQHDMVQTAPKHFRVRCIWV